MSLTEQTIQALRRLEEVVLEALRKRGISRHALGEKYLDGITGETVRRKLVPDRPEGEAPPDATLCFRALEVCEVDAVEVLGSLCPAKSPEVLLSILPIPGFDLQAERKAERTKGYQRRRKLLRVAKELEAAIPRDDPAAKKIWPVRRSDPELGPVYEKLEKLDEERHRDSAAVEKICEKELTRACDSLAFAEAIHRVGLVGIWSSVQRSGQRLYFARDALAVSTSLARKLGDESLLAEQLLRSAAMLKQLEAPGVAEPVLQQVIACCLADQYRDGVGYALASSARVAFDTGNIDLAERRFLAALEQLTQSASPFFRLMIAQGIASCREHHGDLEGALAFLQSIETATYRRLDLKAYLLHTAGNLQRKLHRFQAAEQSYREALKLLADRHDPKAKLKLYFDLSACLVLSGAKGRLPAVRDGLDKLLPRLANQSYVQTQCLLLIRELSTEVVSPRRLEELKAKL